MSCHGMTTMSRVKPLEDLCEQSTVWPVGLENVGGMVGDQALNPAQEWMTSAVSPTVPRCEPPFPERTGDCCFFSRHVKSK